MVIKYLNKAQEKEVEGEIRDFEFMHTNKYSRYSSPYLAVRFKNDLLIRQYKVESWEEVDFDKFISALRR